MENTIPEFSEASVIYLNTLLNKLSFTIQFSEEYKSTPLHWHDYAQLWYVSEGSVVHRVNDAVYTQTAGSFIFVPPFTDHGIDSTKSTTAPLYGQISFTDNFLTKNGTDFFSYDPRFSHFKEKKIPIYSEFSEEDKTKIENILNDMYLEFSKAKNCSLSKNARLLADLFSFITSDSENQPNRNLKYISERANTVISLIRYMSEHYARKLTLNDLCSIAHMSRSFLTENFREVCSKSAFEILISIRLHNALHSLLYSDLTLSQIAKNVGFTTKSRLSHEFTKRYFLSPIEYRKRFQQEYLKRDEILAEYWEQFDPTDKTCRKI